MQDQPSGSVATLPIFPDVKQSRQLWKNLVAGLVLGCGSLAPLAALAAEAADEPDPREAMQRTLVERCEKRWTRNFIPMAKAQLPAEDPVNDEARTVLLDVVVDRKGKVLSADVTSSSGVKGLDEAARDIALDTGPYAPIEEGLLSDDGNLHVRWEFQRKDGLCDNAQIHDVQLPPVQAIPVLLSQGRQDRAWQRLAQAVAEDDDKAVSVFARHWLRVAGKDKLIGQAAMAALAAGGDRDAAARLAALAEAEKLPVAFWQALPRAGQAVCPLAKKALGGKNAEARLAALRALGMHMEKACLGLVAAVASNAAAPVDERVTALKALAASDADEARTAAKKAMEDPNANVRAAAIRAWAQADTGKRALFALTPMLKDPSIAVRAAAHAGVARSSGDKGLEQLYLVYKEKDAQVYEALSEELAQMNTEASAEMLKKFLRKDDPRVKRAAALALSARGDRFARSAVEALAGDADPSLRLLAAHALGSAELQAAASEVAGDEKGAFSIFQALLKGGARRSAAALMFAALPAAKPDSRVEWLGSWLRAAEPPSSVASSRP